MIQLGTHKRGEKMYYIYMLRCLDNTIYTGITKDLERRLKEHKEGKKNVAKYTAVHGAKYFECAWQCENRGDASKLEYWVKTLSKKEKEALIENSQLKNVLQDKICVERYQYCPIKKQGNI